MTATEPTIDFTMIEFPSDKLTILMIRKALPETIDIDVSDEHRVNEIVRKPFPRSSLDDFLGAELLDTERELAEWVFKEKLGQPIVRYGWDYSKSEMIDSLIESYIKLKLAHGEHDASALIQRIEKQAEAQARQFGSLSR